MTVETVAVAVLRLSRGERAERDDKSKQTENCTLHEFVLLSRPTDLNLDARHIVRSRIPFEGLPERKIG